ncbi:hypothetical protein [uncultured Lacinutrix sp.]|uniref:hypothetical protein n=1 Tax=uncultured Lacinutrix sp. TaxID=574032 RepID=UPI002615885B|nr:hypothetical protein [uncultured Lacinutrix sp.]
MKVLKIITSCFILIILNACSNDNELLETNKPSPILTNYIYKSYNINTGLIIDSINYIIQGDKIISLTKYSTTNSDIALSTFNYQNNKLSETRSYTNDVLTGITTYSYNNEGSLTQYLREHINTSNQDSQFVRHLFEHNTDTIFSTISTSSDGITYESPTSAFKIVLDDNDNRIYFEDNDYLNNEITYRISTYDSNNNLLNENDFTKLENQDDILNISFNNSFNSAINLFYRINNATYGKKTLMQLYHLQSASINNFNAKNVSPNSLESFSTSFGNGFFSFQFENNVDTNNLTVYSDFKTFANNALFGHFSQEFILE